MISNSRKTSDTPRLYIFSSLVSWVRSATNRLSGVGLLCPCSRLRQIRESTDVSGVSNRAFVSMEVGSFSPWSLNRTSLLPRKNPRKSSSRDDDDEKRFSSSQGKAPVFAPRFALALERLSLEITNGTIRTLILTRANRVYSVR